MAVANDALKLQLNRLMFLLAQVLVGSGVN
jgi:hypothetical protein